MEQYKSISNSQNFGVGSRFGANYQIDKIIGEGASGIVYRGINLASNEPVAIKILREQYANDQEIIARFITERQTLLQLRDPHVVRVHDLISDQGHLGIVMEYLPGDNLRHILEQRKTLPAGEAVEIVIQVLHALNEAHGKNIVHRDIKPDNIIISGFGGSPGTKDNTELNNCEINVFSSNISQSSNSNLESKLFTVKVTDFGIAKIIGNQNSTTQLVGTPYYMAPELIEREIVAPSVDIYAVGITLYELLCGKTPFHVPNANAFAIARHHLESKPPQITGLDERLWQVIETTLSKEAGQRPNAAQLLEQLLELKSALIDLPALPLQGDSTVIPAATVLRPAKTMEGDITGIESKGKEQSQIEQSKNNRFNPFKRTKKADQAKLVSQSSQLDSSYQLNQSGQPGQLNRSIQSTHPNQLNQSKADESIQPGITPNNNFPKVELPPLVDAGLQTVLHTSADKGSSVDEVLEDIVESQKVNESAAKSRLKKTWVVATGSALAVIVAVTVLVLVFVNREQTAGDTAELLTAASATIEDNVLPSGLIIGRELELDPDKNTLTYSITFKTNNQSISGQVMDSLLTEDGVCPTVDWQVEAGSGTETGASVSAHSAAQTSISAKCAWTFTVPTITAGNPITVSGVIQISEGIPTDETGLEDWLDYISSHTSDTLEDSAVVSTAYPLQRLTGISLEMPSRVVQGEVISISVLGIWPHGVDTVNPIYKSPSGSAAITSVLESISGGQGTESVSITDTCLGAVLVDNEALSVAALYPSSCYISMTMGNFQSDRVSVTISSNGS